MPSDLTTSFGSGDDVLSEHVSQFAKPINDLESGAAFYRVATNSDETYEVDFSSAAIPGGGGRGHYLSSLSEGQVIVFKASADSVAGAELQVALESGTATHPLYADGLALEPGVIKAGQLVFAIYNDEGTGRFDIIGPRSGRAAQLSNLAFEEGDLISVDASGDLKRLPRGSAGDVLAIVLGSPQWQSSGGGVSGIHFLTTGLVAYGYRYDEITSTSDVLESSPFTPESGKTYLIRWIANHSDSVDQLDLDDAITNSEDHYCSAIETGDSTSHTIGFSDGNAYDYDCTEADRTRTHEFVWTASTTNEVRITLGQPSLSYGEFTGTLLVYAVNDNATNLGWGQFGSGYRWLEDATDQTNSLSGGTYKTGVSLDSTKTYAFIGRWKSGYSMKLVLKQSSSYWCLPPTSDTWATASGSDNAWSGGMYYETGNSSSRGEFIRFFSPPSTGTFDLGCCFYDVEYGCFWLLEMPA
jgi:hypothetical protein